MKKKLPNRLKPLVNGKTAVENYKEQLKKRQESLQKQKQAKGKVPQRLDQKVVAEILRKEIEKCLK